ncbi:hypothetical protein BU15DRAFT_75601 [Melanogaster broomeanus]|nr:hypothetical protein BU15DRAFT_75601 [Melanogaster broomeanus]
MSSEKGKHIHLDLQDQLSQKNHRLATKVNYFDRKHDCQLQRDRMHLANTNSQAVHERQLMSKEMDIRLEEAKARSSEQHVKEHVAMTEMLRLQLKLKGIDGEDDDRQL